MVVKDSVLQPPASPSATSSKDLLLSVVGLGTDWAGTCGTGEQSLS